jgi:hypothetical protein
VRKDFPAYYSNISEYMDRTEVKLRGIGHARKNSTTSTSSEENFLHLRKIFLGHVHFESAQR